MSVEEYIEAAREHGVILTKQDFQYYDGEPTLDSMDPSEWIEAMTME